MGGDEVGDRQVGQHVAVGDDERVVDAGVVGGEADGAGGVERLGLDGVVELRRRRSGRRGRRRRTARAGSRGPASRGRRRPRSSWPMRRTSSGTWAIGSIAFGTVLVSGRSRVPNPPTRTTACISELRRTARRPGRSTMRAPRRPEPTGRRRPAGLPRPQRADERLVRRGDGRRRRRGDDPRPPAPAHRRRRRRGRRRSRRTAAVNASGSSGATASPPPDAASRRGISVPGSMAATTGRPAARIEYVFDGTLTAAEPALQRDGVDVAGRQQLGQPVLRHVAGEADVGQPVGGADRARRGRRPRR